MNPFDSRLLDSIDYLKILANGRNCVRQCHARTNNGAQCQQCAIGDSNFCYAHTNADPLMITDDLTTDFPAHYKKYLDFQSTRPTRFYYEDGVQEHRLISQLLREIKSKCRKIQIPTSTTMGTIELNKVEGANINNRFIIMLHIPSAINNIVNDYVIQKLRYTCVNFYPEYIILTNVTIDQDQLINSSARELLYVDVFSPYVNTGQYDYFFTYLAYLFKQMQLKNIIIPPRANDGVADIGQAYDNFMYRIGVINKVDEYGQIFVNTSMNPTQLIVGDNIDETLLSQHISRQHIDLRPLATIAIIKSLSVGSGNIKEHYYINLEDNIIRFLYTKSLLSFKHIDVPNSNILLGDFIPPIFNILPDDIAFGYHKFSATDVTYVENFTRMQVHILTTFNTYPCHYNVFDDHLRHQVEHRREYECESIKEMDSIIKARVRDKIGEYMKFLINMFRIVKKNYGNRFVQILQNMQDVTPHILAAAAHEDSITFQDVTTVSNLYARLIWYSKSWDVVNSNHMNTTVHLDTHNARIPMFSSYVALICNGRAVPGHTMHESRSYNCIDLLTGYSHDDEGPPLHPFSQNFPTCIDSKMFYNLLMINTKTSISPDLAAALFINRLKEGFYNKSNISYWSFYDARFNDFIKGFLTRAEVGYYGNNMGGHITSDLSPPLPLPHASSELTAYQPLDTSHPNNETTATTSRDSGFLQDQINLSTEELQELENALNMYPDDGGLDKNLFTDFLTSEQWPTLNTDETHRSTELNNRSNVDESDQYVLNPHTVTLSGVINNINHYNKK